MKRFINKSIYPEKDYRKYFDATGSPIDENIISHITNEANQKMIRVEIANRILAGEEIETIAMLLTHYQEGEI